LVLVLRDGLDARASATKEASAQVCCRCRHGAACALLLLRGRPPSRAGMPHSAAPPHPRAKDGARFEARLLGKAY
jgi:hypothetical protein